LDKIKSIVVSEAGERRERAIIAEREPHHVSLLRVRIWLGRVLGEAVERHQAAVLRLQPAPPMRRVGVADIGHRRATGAGRRRHAPRLAGEPVGFFARGRGLLGSGAY